MKSKTFYVLFSSAIIFVLGGTSSCDKPYQPVGKTLHELPFSENLANGNLFVSGFSSTPVPPSEIGYGFTSSRPGIVDKLGVMFPDSGKTYTVSLWDGASQQLLVQKNITIIDPSAFNYVDLIPTNEFQVILPNHPYVISVFMIPDGMVYDAKFFYDWSKLRRTDGTNVLPVTGNTNVISFNQGYENNGPYSSAFPEDPLPNSPYLIAPCDIEFTYVQPY